MNNGFIYLQDDKFTKAVVADKINRKLSNDTFKMFSQIVNGLTYKSNYIGYNDMIKQDMASEANYIFNANWKTFSPIRKEIKTFLDAYVIEDKIGRNYYNEIVKEIVEQVELSLFEDDILRKLGIDEEGILIFNSTVEALKDVTDYDSGAYSFFTALAENAFRVVLNRHYDSENATRKLIDLCYSNIQTFDESEEF